MITPQQAEELINSRPLQTEHESVSLMDAVGRILQEDLHADTDLPPFNRVMMDGIAIRFSALANGVIPLRVQGIQRAGMAPLMLEDSNACIEIMTGAVCPEGCDTVVPYEHIRIEQGVAIIEIPPASIGKNIHRAGSDQKKGAQLVQSGIIITAAEIGIAASIGKSSLLVTRNPRVIICSTGDELVEIEQEPLPHQIRRSNVYALQALFKRLNITTEETHLPDEAAALRLTLTKALAHYDILILSGGVSKGKYDLVPEVLKELGVSVAFHGIAQRPGKPMWFGYSNKTTVFALPGNPVSTLACAARYVMPWLEKQLFNRNQTLHFASTEEIVPHEKMTLFLPVKLESTKNECVGTPLKNQGSGDFSALSGMHGFVEIPPGLTQLPAGSHLRYFPIL
jgi:molybdopterin molybdotransferase